MAFSKRVPLEKFASCYFLKGGILSLTVLITPQDIDLDPEFQLCDELANFEHKVYRLCWENFGPAVSGQFTCRYSCSRILLCAVEIFYRWANMDELSDELHRYGKQFFKYELSNDHGKIGCPILTENGKNYLYGGPLRFKEANCALISCEGKMHDRALIYELIKKLAGRPRSRFCPSDRSSLVYFVFEADNGKIHVAGFSDQRDFNPCKSLYFGDTWIQRRKMFFFPKGVRSNPIDFSGHIIVY